MRTNLIFLLITTATSPVWTDREIGIAGFIVGVIGLFVGVAGVCVSVHYGRKEKKTLLSSAENIRQHQKIEQEFRHKFERMGLLEYAYKFTLFLRDINKRTKSYSWNKGRKATDIRTEIVDLIVEVNKYLPYLESKQKLSLQNKLTDVQNYIADFLTGTDEAITFMMSRMNKVDAELQEITKDLKG